MLRGIRLALAGFVLVALTGVQARAQYYYPYGYGYGGYGFGGWSSTVQGSVLQGMGAYAQGAGVYNYDTAVATSVDVDSYIKLNQYLWNSELDARRRWESIHSKRMNLSRDEYKAHLKRIRENPTEGDIESGNALNAILNQFVDPKVIHNSSSLRMANGEIPAKAIREIPFIDETDAVTLSLDQLTDPNSWPLPLRADEFKSEREAYQKAVDDALEEDKAGGTLKPETIARVRNAVSVLYSKVEGTIPRSSPDHLTAINYLKGLAGLSKMLEKPNVEAVLAELEKVETTTVGHLMAFMHTYNLRFGAATTPKQKAVYRDLYPVMVAQRDKVIGKPGPEPEPPAPAAKIDNPTAVFYGLDPTHLNTKPSSPK